MSEYCTGDPIQRIVNNRKISLFDPQQRRIYKHRGNNLQDRHSASPGVEASFLHRNGVDSDRGLGLGEGLPVSQPAMVAGREEDWVSEFSSVSVRDPLEFSDTYKSLYRQYEMRSQPGTSILCKNEPLPRGPRPFNRVLKPPCRDIIEKEALEREFQIVQEETEDNQKAAELEFQESARQFVSVCEQSDSKEKLKKSKVFELMQRVGDGTATIQNQNDTYTIE